MIQMPYNDLTAFFAKYFDTKVQKVSINAGFTCPNRDGTKGIGGCTYCNNQTFSPGYTQQPGSVKAQLLDGIQFFSRKYPSMRYLAYFQSYTGTYGGADELNLLYREALEVEGVVGIVISTRPDMLSVVLMELLREIARHSFVMLELGIESTNDDTLRFINRGHTFDEARQGVLLAHQYGIPVGAHLILGLPNESREMQLNHAVELSKLPISTLKLHQLQIIKNTKMSKQWEESPQLFHLYDVDEYIDHCIDFIEILSPAIHIDRFISQSPDHLLVAPHWGLKNYQFKDKLMKRIQQRESYQGKQYIQP